MKVVVIQDFLPEYRIPFFEGLKRQLKLDNISLDLYHSKTKSSKLINSNLSWATPVNTVKIFGFKHFLLPKKVFTYDLIIIPQEVKYTHTFILLLASFFNPKIRVCFWGHGKNLQAKSRKEKLIDKTKKIISKNAFWWFAYNDFSAKIVADFGYPKQRITSIQNTIEKPQQKAHSCHHESYANKLKQKSNNILIFSGGFYAEKRIDFLILSSKEVRKKVRDLELVLIGSGELFDSLKNEHKNEEWIHFTGKLTPSTATYYWDISKLALMPGLVGLVVIDSFIHGTPLVTTNYPYHSPEFSYITHAKNGWITDNWRSSSCYAKDIEYILENDKTFNTLKTEAKKSSHKYSMEAMINNMRIGIKSAINYQPTFHS